MLSLGNEIVQIFRINWKVKIYYRIWCIKTFLEYILTVYEITASLKRSTCSNLKKMDAMKKGWFSELSTLWPGQCMSLEIKEVLYDKKSKYQHVIVADT